jgi:hypothetical protein
MDPRTFPRWNGRVALIFGQDSHLNPYAHRGDPDAVFRRAFPAGYSVDIVTGSNGHFFEQHVEGVLAVLKRRLLEVPTPPPADAPPAPDAQRERRFVPKWWRQRQPT